MVARIATGGHGGMTIKQIEHCEQVVKTGGGITDDDSPATVITKLKSYQDALQRLHDLGGGKGPLRYAEVPTGGYKGHYEIDPDALQGIIKDWENVIHGIKEDQQYIDTIVSVSPPAPDVHASVAQAQSLAQFGDRMQKRNDDMLKYAEMYLKHLKDTKKTYLEQESHTQESMRKQMGDA